MKFYLTNLLFAFFLMQSVFLLGKSVQNFSTENFLCEYFIDYKNFNHETFNYQQLKPKIRNFDSYSSSLGTSTLEVPFLKRQPNPLLYLNHEGVLVLTANISHFFLDFEANILSISFLKMGHYD